MCLLQGGDVTFGTNGVCWDCPLSFRHATELVAVVFICVAIGVWLRQSGKPRLRAIGGCLFIFAAVEIFVIHHAGWDWGIIQTMEPRQYYNRFAVSAFSLLLAIVATVLIIH